MGTWQGNFIMPDDDLTYQMSLSGTIPDTAIHTALVTRYWVAPKTKTIDQQKRHKLFERWTVPSVMNQTYQPDVWLILISEWILPHIEPLFSRYPLPSFAKIVTVPSGGAATPAIRIALEEYQAAHWIVARCDNDDAIAPDYFYGLVKYVEMTKPSGAVYLTYPLGQQTIDGEFESYLDVHPANHFIASYDSVHKDYLVPYKISHADIFRTRNTVPVKRLLTRQPMWTEVIHNDNELNHLRGGPGLCQV